MRNLGLTFGTLCVANLLRVSMQSWKFSETSNIMKRHSCALFLITGFTCPRHFSTNIVIISFWLSFKTLFLILSKKASKQTRAFSSAPGFESLRYTFHWSTCALKKSFLLYGYSALHKFKSSSNAPALTCQFLDIILFSSGPELSAFSAADGPILFPAPPPIA